VADENFSKVLNSTSYKVYIVTKYSKVDFLIESTDFFNNNNNYIVLSQEHF